MATEISNQARLTYRYGTATASAASNIATTLLDDGLTVSKTSLDEAYRAGNSIPYIIAFTNTGTSALTDLNITDDLGTYTLPGPVDVTPLTYVGPARLYINGVFSAVVTPTVDADSVTFPIGTLAPGANAILVYQGAVNEGAPLAPGSEITNTATFSATGLAEDLTAANTLNVENYANVEIMKSMAPNPVTDGDRLTYSFTLSNYGNTDATNVVLTDTFTPEPTALSVTVDGATVPDADFSYTGGNLTLPAAGSAYSITVPAATFTQDDTTGAVTTEPGTVRITVTGTI